MVAKRYPEKAAINPPNDGVMEVSLLISHTQFDALEQAARTAQITVAQYIRRLVQFSIDHPNTDALPDRWRP